jgi:hypothetical protein
MSRLPTTAPLTTAIGDLMIELRTWLATHCASGPLTDADRAALARLYPAIEAETFHLTTIQRQLANVLGLDPIPAPLTDADLERMVRENEADPHGLAFDGPPAGSGPDGAGTISQG